MQIRTHSHHPQAQIINLVLGSSFELHYMSLYASRKWMDGIPTMWSTFDVLGHNVLAKGPVCRQRDFSYHILI